MVDSAISVPHVDQVISVRGDLDESDLFLSLVHNVDLWR